MTKNDSTILDDNILQSIQSVIAQLWIDQTVSIKHNYVRGSTIAVYKHA